MDIKQIRLHNLRTLIQEVGSIAKLARLSETAPAYLSQILNSLPTSAGRPRSVGDRLARKLESATAKPYGWMDRDHDDGEPSAPHVHHVPLLDSVRAIDCLRSGNCTELRAEATFPVPVPVSGAAVAIRVEGDHLEPKFHDGDIIVVDPSMPPATQSFVVAQPANIGDGFAVALVVEEAGGRYLVPLDGHSPRSKFTEDSWLGKIVYRGEVL